MRNEESSTLTFLSSGHTRLLSLQSNDNVVIQWFYY